MGALDPSASDSPRDLINPSRLLTQTLGKLQTLTSGWRARLHAATPSSRLVCHLLRALIVLQVLEVGGVFFFHEPWFSFEESNTLNTSELSRGEMSEVLAQDQNYPVYYWLLHFLGSVFGFEGRAAMAFNFACWLLSIYAFKKLASELLEEKSWQLLATLLFAATPSLFVYAYFVRMYVQANLLLMVCLLMLVRYTRTGKLPHLVMGGLCLLGLGLLHPTGAICAVLFAVAGCCVASGLKHGLVVLFFSGGTVAIACAEAFGKSDFRRIYLESGVQYIRTISTPLYTFMSRLLGHTEGSYAWVYFVVGALLLFEFFRRAPIFSRQYFALTLFNGAFILLHVLLKSYVDSHHFFFLTGTLVLALAIGLYHLTASGTRHRFLLCAVPLVFLTGSYLFSFNEFQTCRRYQHVCASLKELQPGAVITDFVLHDIVAHCVPPNTQRVFVLTDKDLVETTHASLKDVLILQAKLGGLPASGVATVAYRSMLSEALTDGKGTLRKQVGELLARVEDVYFVLPLSRTSLFPEEIDLLDGFKFRQLVRSSVYWFHRESR